LFLMAPDDVVVTWTRRGARISTLHPVYGELYRGRVWKAGLPDPYGGYRGSWILLDQDGLRHGVLFGDYLDAEARLLELTAWADEPYKEPSAPLFEGEEAA
jgi:hypothetical protein